MQIDTGLSNRVMRTGVIFGLIAVLMYLLLAILPLPTFLRRPFWVLIGPFMTIAFVGLFPFIATHRVTVTAILGTVMGVLAGALRCASSVVQSSNLHYIRRYTDAESSESAQQVWQNILSGVFTVQNGLNYAYDLFLDLAVLMLAIALWHHPGPGRIFAITGAAAGATHLSLKLVTYPEPPAEAGLVDVGPVLGLWFLALLVWILWRRPWADGSDPTNTSLHASPDFT